MHLFGPDTDHAELRRALEAGEHFWLDIPLGSFTVDNPVAQALGVTEERLNRVKRREGRSMVIVEHGHALIVFAGAARGPDSIGRVAVVVIASDNALVTLRDLSCQTLDELRESPRDVDALGVVDALSDSLLEIADGMEEDVEEAEIGLLQPRSQQELAKLTALRRQVSDLLKIAREQRGIVERSQDELSEVPVRFGNAERRVRDLENHLARATDSAESTRQTIAEALNLYLSITAENLTRIATVLFPLTVVSGFFGMNFTWMINHVDSFWAFMVFGIGGMIVSVAGVRLYIARKGYT